MENKNAYDLTRELIEVMADIDRKLDIKNKMLFKMGIGSLFGASITTNAQITADINNQIDAEINELEARMYEIKNKLKAIKI